MIPFVHSPQTRAIDPLKLNEYLAAGKPVVLTPFADLREFMGQVYTADGSSAFGAAITQALAEETPLRRAERVALARENGWAGRLAEIEDLLLDTLERRESRRLSA